MMAFKIDQYEVTVSVDDLSFDEKVNHEFTSVCPKLSDSEFVKCTVQSPTQKVVRKEECFHNWFLKKLIKTENMSTIALIEEIGESRCVTYEELINSAYKIATYMSHHGVKKGDRVLICMDNSVELVLYLLGVFLIGAVPFFVNPGHIVLGVSDNVNCTSAVVDFESFKSITDISTNGIKSLERIFVLTYDITIIQIPRHLWIIDGFGFMSFSAQFSFCDQETPSLAFIFSRSQKNKECVMHTQKTASKICKNFFEHLFKQLPDMDNKNHLITNGLHNYKSLCYLIYVLRKNETCILTESHQEVWKASFIDQISGIIEQYKVPTLFSNSHFLKCLVKYEVPDIFELSCLKAIINIGPAISYLVAKKLHAILYSARLYQAYGDFEFGIASYGLVNNNSPDILSNCGAPLKGIKIKIADMNTDKEVDCGKWGQLILRGPQLSYHIPEKNQVNNSKCWYKTGDYGMIDENKTLHVHGSISNLLQTNDKMVPSELIECVLSSHKNVDEAVVMQSGKKIWCGILLGREMACPTFEQLENFLKAYKLYLTINKITVLDFIPRSEDGTILRDEVPYLMEAIGNNDSVKDVEESYV